MKKNIIINQKIAHFSIRKTMVSVLLLLCCTSIAQLKKNLTENEYSQWSTFSNVALSEAGNWASYKLNYENKEDTLFVKSTHENYIYSFPKGTKGKFLKASVFVYQEPDHRLVLINLDSQKKIVLPDVVRFESVNDGKYIITLNNKYGVKSILHIRDENGKTIDSIGGVTSYVLNGTKDALVYNNNISGKHMVGIIVLKKYKRDLIISANLDRFHTFAWQRNGNSIAFLKETDSVSKSNTLLLYQLSQKKLITLEPKDFKEMSERHITTDLKLTISDDGSKVFFGVKTNNLVSSDTENAAVEIWNGNAPWVYPMEKSVGNWKDTAKLHVWFAESGICLPVSSDDFPDVQLTGKQEYAILSNPKSYAPHYKLDGDVDYYITDLKKNTRTLFLKQQVTDENDLIIYPYGNQIAYYRDSNWWLYDPNKDKKVNLTRGNVSVWDSGNDTLAPPVSPYNCPGWSSDGKYLILYDIYDIWIAALDGSGCKRLTRGREKNIVFRISPYEFSNKFSAKYGGRATALFDLSKEIILEATDKDDCSTGYYIWNAKEGEKLLAHYDSAIDQIHKSKNSSYVFIKQKFDTSPVLLFKENKSSRNTVLFASNPQQQRYNWGRSELIHYTNKSGQALKGILLYPSDFDKEKKYPMIVHIYEIRSAGLHRYTNPSLYNDEGFNVTNYTLNGYFVLLPDIVYEYGNPGLSATECVLAAVKNVTEMGFVDSKKIGLTGHSFGAYESSFIITQTDVFSAAISGAGISDIVRWYFSIGQDVQAPEAWRFESQLFRMGKTFYEDKESYFRNSPILNAAQITTPLLQWTGKEDPTVAWDQSVAFYIALRRLQKKHMLLVYPDEPHVIFNRENQKDLTLRTKQWFDHYLKKELPAEWISVGTKWN